MKEGIEPARGRSDTVVRFLAPTACTGSLKQLKQPDLGSHSIACQLFLPTSTYARETSSAAGLRCAFVNFILRPRSTKHIPRKIAT